MLLNFYCLFKSVYNNSCGEDVPMACYFYNSKDCSMVLDNSMDLIHNMVWELPLHQPVLVRRNLTKKRRTLNILKATFS